MAKNYEVYGWIKLAVKDSFEHGQIGKESQFFGKDKFCSKTIAGVIEQCLEFCGADMNCAILDSCDEQGRLDVQILEDGSGTQASSDLIEKWKLGKCQLWMATYTFYVEQVTRKPCILTGILHQEEYDCSVNTGIPRRQSR